MTVSAPHEFEMDLRWSDQDLMGHVNNAKIVTLAEEARIRFFQFLSQTRSAGAEAGTDTGAEAEAEMNRVVARQEIDYHAQTHYAPAITMQVGVLRIGTKSYTLRQRGIQDGRAVFTVDTVMVNLDGSGASRTLSAAERSELEAWGWPAEPASL